MPSGTVIVASGGSDPTSPLRAARAFTTGTSRNVVAVAVLEPLPVYGPTGELVLLPPEFEAERQATLEEALSHRLAPIVDDATRWTSRIVYGDPAHALTELAREEHAGLIVMGIGRHRLIDRILGAETSLRTVERAECAVLAVVAGVAALPRRVVIGTDFSVASVSAARQAMPFVAPDATLFFVHCWEPIKLANRRAELLNAEYRASLPAKFSQMIGQSNAPSGAAQVPITREGRPADALLTFAEENQADLIVAGRQGRGLIDRMLVGSVTRRLLRLSTCSVFVAHGSAS